MGIRTTLPLAGAILFALSPLLAQPLPAERFAIHTEIADRPGGPPVAKHITIFEDTQIVDFLLTEPRSVSVFDRSKQRFVLGLEAQKVKTAVSAQELLHFVADEQASAEHSPSAWVRFAANPHFTEKFDRESGAISLTSPYWDYHVEPLPEVTPSMRQQYGEFALWYTYLNALFQPWPPSVRLELNRVLEQHDTIPALVRVDIKKKSKSLSTRESRHTLVPELTHVEQELLRNWEKDQAEWKPISLDQFRAALAP